ncbi:Uncharacterised protein [Macrococcoides caseolyticum]|uniref:hypothetical protein n=1 Tax=Macrococcoides caseolyticum TaxID=69966 RepID=UPI0011717E4D|nr:hypothetical protein [Macrococcus caseolyticus]VUC68925.1 Uncharacterised protein [Macrococcus caseolyticus]
MDYEKMWNSLKKHIEKQKESVVGYYADNVLIEEKTFYDNDELSIRATLLKMDELEELLGDVEQLEKENEE